MLFLGVTWFAMFCVASLFEEPVSWMGFGWLTLAAIYFLLYGLQVTKQFGKLQQDKLFLHHERLKPKEIDLKEVNEVRYFAGDYIFKTDRDQVRINTELIEEASIQKLEDIISAYDLQLRK